MEISARVLREVEFNSSLRGYNTDEVDEFLEQVADGVDRLQAETRAAAERVAAAERAAQERPMLDDDDSIRRTLVLAQRTADLAIREAQEEAGQILDRARGEAETLVTDARDSAGRITSEAERRLQEEVARLSSARDSLRSEVDTLVSLLGAERERLTETLGAALRYVERSLAPSGPLMSLQAVNAPQASDDSSGDTGSTVAEAPAGETRPAEGDEATSAYAIVARPEADVPGDHAPAEGSAPEGEATSTEAPEVDDLEAGIAADAAAAAPVRHNEPESDHYDWDSVIRGRTEPFVGDRQPRTERANLTALPSLEERSETPAQLRIRSTDWPA